MVLQRVDPTVNFDWGTGSPGGAVGADHFSARWTGFVQPQFNQVYTFYTWSDEGVRLWIDGQLVIDNWTPHPPAENSAGVRLKAGRKYAVRLEYRDVTDPAVLGLLWSSPSTPKSVIPRADLFP